MLPFLVIFMVMPTRQLMRNEIKLEQMNDNLEYHRNPFNQKSSSAKFRAIFGDPVWLWLWLLPVFSTPGNGCDYANTVNDRPMETKKKKKIKSGRSRSI